MAEQLEANPTDVTVAGTPVVPPVTPPEAAQPTGEPTENKGDLNIALSQERQRANDLQQKLDAINAEKERERRGSLSDEDRIEQKRADFHSTVIITTAAEDIAKLPTSMQERLRINPLALVDPREATIIESTASSPEDKWRRYQSAAVASIKEVASEMPQAPVIPAPTATPTTPPSGEVEVSGNAWEEAIAQSLKSQQTS